MDVVEFLDALSWGNDLAIVDPTTRSARTNLMHSDRLATVVSRWLCPPRTSRGGSRAEGARHALLPLVLDTVKGIINDEMDAVVEELKEDSAEVTEQSVLGTVIDEVQEKVQVIAPVFYDLVRTASWSEDQEERNKLKDPTKVNVLHGLCRDNSSKPTLSVSRLSSARQRFPGITLPTKCIVPSRFT
jgi:hypothetical protein